MTQLRTPQELEEYRQGLTARAAVKRPCISVCSGTGCLASGGGEVVAAFREQLAAPEREADVQIRGTGCRGFCERGPVVVLHPAEICYLGVKPADVPEIVAQSIRGGQVVERLLFADPATGERTVREADIPFYRHQQRTLLASNALLDPARIDDYLAIGGYSALVKALFEMSPEGVLEEVKQARLRGRGGAGFPAGSKWEGSRRAPDRPKYVIVNADEGDPGAFMDRSLLEGNPHSLLEGLVIGGYVIGA
ncbi:MAG: NADH-quinone oxidoreductase subunit F, partial [Deltaproteobacteria bacterium]|nr:NADH-quinone oxidoreductase subunit F [Deltaproteobacteria bacterium]